MADLEQFKTVDLIVNRANDNTFIPKQYASSGDIAGRTTTLQVTDDGVVNELPGIGATAAWYNKASGQTGLDAFEIVDKSKNILVWTYPQSMLTPGTVEVVISIQYQGKSTDLRKFTIEVQQVNGQMAGIVSSEAYKALTSALARVNEYDTNIAQLQTYKADKVELNQAISNVASGTPKESFDSLSALQTKYPNGKEGTFLVKQSDGYHNYMYQNGTWKDLGVYQGITLSEDSVANKNLLANTKNATVASFSTAVDALDMTFTSNVVTVTIRGNYNVVIAGTYYQKEEDIVLTYDAKANFANALALIFNEKTETFSLQAYRDYKDKNSCLVAFIVFDKQQIISNSLFTKNKALPENVFKQVSAYINGNRLPSYTKTTTGIQITHPGNRLYARYSVSGKTVTTDFAVTSPILVDNNLSLVIDTIAKTLDTVDTAQIDFARHIVLLSVNGMEIKYSNLVFDSYYNFESIAFYCGEGVPFYTSQSKDAVVNFTYTANDAFYIKSKFGNTFLNLNKQDVVADKKIVIPHNNSLVYNARTNKLYIVDTDNIDRTSQFLIASAHEGRLKFKSGLLIEELANPKKYIRTPELFKSRYVSQGGTVVGNEILIFDDGRSLGSQIANVFVLDKETLEEKRKLTHNLGHGNGVDYRNGRLVVFDGNGNPPRVSLLKYDNTKTFLDANDAGTTVITFKEGTKVLTGDGGACFGENERILYYADNTFIYRFILGTGSLDYSDTTSDKSDFTKWGTFKTVADGEYNGTALLTNKFVGMTYPQVQDMYYDGRLNIAVGFSQLLINSFELDFTKNTFRLQETILCDMRKDTNVQMAVEPEFVAKANGIFYIGGRGDVSGVAKFTL